LSLLRPGTGGGWVSTGRGPGYDGGMKRLVVKLAFALLLTFVAAPVRAQINDSSVTPGNIDTIQPSQRPIFEYILAGGSLVAALAIGFKPSKRVLDA
jgi:hypothetical protein